MQRPGEKHSLLVDGHVHFHAVFDPSTFFTNALANFERGADDTSTSSTSGVLCFTESAGVEWLRTFRGTGATPDGVWRFLPTEEEESLRAHQGDGHHILLVAGRQIVTREGLEVLALGTTAPFPDGLGLLETVDATLVRDAIPVVPWGFGKWWLRRGILLTELLRSPLGRSIFLGDNAGRLQQAGTPRHFALARELRRPILPGSDPLPFAHQVDRPGRYGFILEGQLDQARPAEALKMVLRGLAGQPAFFGKRSGLIDFAGAQVGMQWRKHVRRAV